MCNAGYYVPVPSFTTCVACRAGTFSTGYGQLDSVEWASGTYTFSSSQTAADCNMPALDAEGGWCPKTTTGSEWIQLDMGAVPQRVNGIITQGRATGGEGVLSFNVGYSLDGVIWSSLAGPIQLRQDGGPYARVLSMLPAPPRVARYVRLWPLSYITWPSLRWNALVTVAEVCKTCAAGFYSIGINVSTCAACAPAPVNGYYYGGECDTWKCNSGYYRRSELGSCVRCQNSTLCLSGQFRPPCTDGLTDTQNCTGQCTNRAQNAQAVYLGPSLDNTESGCLWGCNQGYFKNASDSSCGACPPPCNVGYYTTAACVSLVPELMNEPRCLGCTVPSNAQPMGPGLVPGNASSCPVQCNAGYYWSPPFNCTAWTALCAGGFAWSPGTATTDATCSACAHQGDFNYVFYAPNLCNFTCGVGYELVLNGTQCQGCAAGKFKSTTMGVPCAPCPPNTYQNNPAQSFCMTVPPNAVANAMSTGFVCNDGYVFQSAGLLAALLSDSCAACAGNPVPNASLVGWRGCSVTSLTCNPGFYRNWTSAVLCLPCGSLPPPNSGWAPYNASAFCPACNSTLPMQDFAVSCTFACNAGYYYNGNQSLCTRCGTVSCSLGLYAQLCTGGANKDVCMNCSYQLSSSQMWVQQGCQWQCLAGFTLMGDGCVQCPAGTYKTGVGNQTCERCGPGQYAASALSCASCPPGSYNPGTYAACAQCPSGLMIAQSGATACVSCDVTWPNSYALSSRTGCSQCDWATPYSGNGSTCGSPSPPCPGGYYLPYQGTACLLCPQGTFCAPGQPPVFCSGPYSMVPATSAADCIGTDGLNPLTSCPDHMAPSP